MRTTTRSSRSTFRVPGTSRFPFAICLIALPFLIGCVSPADPAEFFKLTPESAAQKAAQTRHFETPSEAELLSASAAVLQDLGFQVVESAKEVGFLRAAKERSARQYGQEILRVVVAVISSVGLATGSNTLTVIPVDLHQQINAVLVTRPLDENGTRHEVRVTFYRLVWKGSGQSGSQAVAPGEQRREMIRSPGIYQHFFASLSKAVFLEAQRI